MERRTRPVPLVERPFPSAEGERPVTVTTVAQVRPRPVAVQVVPQRKVVGRLEVVVPVVKERPVPRRALQAPVRGGLARARRVPVREGDRPARRRDVDTSEDAAGQTLHSETRPLGRAEVRPRPRNPVFWQNSFRRSKCPYGKKTGTSSPTSLLRKRIL